VEYKYTSLRPRRKADPSDDLKLRRVSEKARGVLKVTKDWVRTLLVCEASHTGAGGGYHKCRCAVRVGKG